MKLERSLKDQELKILNMRLRELKNRDKRSVIFSAIWTLVALLVGTVAYSQITKRDLTTLLLATIAIYIGIGIWVMIEQYVKNQRQRRDLLHLKNKDIVTSIEVKSTEYLQLNEFEDEGFHYLFQLADNIILSVGGQDFYPTESFPNDHFEIVEGYGVSDNLIFFETFNYGNKINPTWILKGREKFNLMEKTNYPDPEQLTLTSGTIQRFLRSPRSTNL